MIPDTASPRSARTLTVLAAALLLCTVPAAAQTVGDCAPGTAEADLDVNDVRARVFNGGNLFFGNRTDDGSGYLVPKRLGLSPVFVSNLWIGGKVGGELRVAGSRYDDFEFWPGPLGPDGAPPADCAAFDRIYRVSRADVARYLETGEATADLRDWPAGLGAPTLDGDGIAGNYDLEGGDEPAISGEQMAWWVMNDAGNEHLDSLTPPIQLEAQVSAFAVSSLALALHQATLYRYRLTYRGHLPLDSAYVTIWTDSDLGDASDDYVGSDTTLDMGYTYNAVDPDGSGGLNGGYGDRPPALGVEVLRGPVGLPNGRDDNGDGAVDEVGERLGMTAAPCYAKTRIGEPEVGPEYYNCMRGRWTDGTPITLGGDGYNTDGPITNFGFPGDPVMDQFWSEGNVDGEGNDTSPGDRRFVVVTGPFRLEPGQSTEVVFAIPFARGTDRLDSVVELREAARFVQRAYDLGVFEPQRVGALQEAPPLPDAFGLSRPFPNPFRSSTSLTLRVPENAGKARLAVYDVLGREVALLADGVLPPGEQAFSLSGAGLPAGVYLVRLRTARQTETLKVLHVE